MLSKVQVGMCPKVDIQVGYKLRYYLSASFGSYEPFDVISMPIQWNQLLQGNRLRVDVCVQKHLLYVRIRDIKIAFNKKLAEARATKVSHISRIAEMKSRIVDLHKMLSMPGEYPWPELNEVIDVSCTTPSANACKVDQYLTLVMCWTLPTCWIIFKRLIEEADNVFQEQAQD